jgi:hypothetical protein
LRSRGARAAQARRFASYDFADVAAGFFADPWPFVLDTNTFADETWILTTTYTAPNFVDFEGTGVIHLRLDATQSDDDPLDAADDVLAVITRIR